MKKVKEQIEEVEEEEVNRREHLTIQSFMEDMRMLDEQLKNKDLVKPVFDFGSSNVTNYILWLILGELSLLNDSLEEE